MKKYLSIIAVVLMGCNHSANLKPEDTKLSRSLEMQKEINYILSLDEAYKMEEKMYLEEIRKAQAHDDEDAFMFFLREYAKVKRLDLPEWIKKEPNYIEGGVNIKY
jgi:predicted ATP-grasp superfamily ATP-dependent carboligase